MNEAGEIVKELLRKKGMSQKDLCEKTDISASAMSKYLSSERIPRTEILMKISQAIGVDVNVLLGRPTRNTDTYSVCKSALLARGGASLTDKEKRELIDLILSK